MLGQRCHSDKPVLYFAHLGSSSVVTHCLWWLTQQEIRDMVLYSTYLLVRLIHYISVVYNNLSHIHDGKYCSPEYPLKVILVQPKADLHDTVN